MNGNTSFPAVLMPGPKFTGVPHFCVFLSYFEYQISFSPCPPGIFDAKNMVWPSAVSDGAAYLSVSIQKAIFSGVPLEFPFLVAIQSWLYICLFFSTRQRVKISMSPFLLMAERPSLSFVLIGSARATGVLHLPFLSMDVSKMSLY